MSAVLLYFSFFQGCNERSFQESLKLYFANIDKAFTFRGLRCYIVWTLKPSFQVKKIWYKKLGYVIKSLIKLCLLILYLTLTKHRETLQYRFDVWMRLLIQPFLSYNLMLIQKCLVKLVKLSGFKQGPYQWFVQTNLWYNTDIITFYRVLYFVLRKKTIINDGSACWY